MHGRRGVGDRPQLCGVWGVEQRGNHVDVRGGAEPTGTGPLLANHRETPGNDLLHGTHRDPGFHPLGRPLGSEARPLHPPVVGVGRRADQPGGVALVPPRGGWGTLPDCGHLVADGDGQPHVDHVAGSACHEARSCGSAFLRGGSGGGGRPRQAGEGRRAGQVGDPKALALDAADDLRGSGAVQEAVLERGARLLLHRRRRQAGQGRLFSCDRADRRRLERVGPPVGHGGSGKRAGEPSGGGGGGGGGTTR